MPVRDEGIKLRLIADQASLREGTRELQRWSKEVDQLSGKIKKGLGSKEDFDRLTQHQKQASKTFTELQGKLRTLTQERETYLKRISEAPTAGLRQEFRMRERDISRTMRGMERQQERLGGLEARAGVGMEAPDAAAAARGGPGAVTGAMRFARRLPLIGGLLTGGAAIMGLKNALAFQRELEESAARTTMAFARMGEDTGLMAKNIREAGGGFGFLRGERLQAAAAGMFAGGPMMQAQMPGIFRLARMRGIDPTMMAAMTGGLARGAGAFAPGDVGGGMDFMARMEGARMTAVNPLSMQQYLQSVLPFLQQQGKFMPVTQKPEAAFNRLYTTLIKRAGTNVEEQAFINRNIGGVVQGISQAIRAPQGEAAQFFTMRALGLGEEGVSFYDVMRRQQRGLTEENLMRYVGRAKELSKLRVGGLSPKENFSLGLMNMTQGQVPIEMAERLFDANVTGKSDLMNVLREEGFKSFDELALPPAARESMKAREVLEDIKVDFGKFMMESMPIIIDSLQAVKRATEFWLEGKFLPTVPTLESTIEKAGLVKDFIGPRESPTNRLRREGQENFDTIKAGENVKDVQTK